MGRNGLEIRPKSVRIRFTHQGVHHSKTFKLNGAPLLPTVANIKYAERLANEIQQRIKLGLFDMADYFPEEVTTSAATVKECLDRFLATCRITESTGDGYTTAVNFWDRAFGSKPVIKLKRSEILAASAARPDLTGKTLNNYMAVLKQTLDMAVQDGAIASNPAESIKRFAHQKPMPDPFDQSEVARIIAHMRDKYDRQVHNLIEFWLWTGMRTGEIYGLDWANVDLAKGQVLVCEAIVRGKNKGIKTSVSRIVHLNSKAMAAIQRQRANTQMQGGKVFRDPRTGAPWLDERLLVRNFWTPALKALGIRYRRPYNMRHTYATAMLMAGMTPAFCAKQLGHSVEMFLKTYARWIDGDQNAREMARLESQFAPDLPQKEAGSL